jgi:hypothetical protein
MPDQPPKLFYMPLFQRKRLFLLIFFIGILLRGYLLVAHLGNGIQNADEATVGIMAQHIAEGRHFPLIWYGQQYMGTLPSFISALLFRCFGISATAVRIVPIAFSILLIYLIYLLATEMFGESVGLLSALWIAVCPPFLGVFSLKQAGYMVVLCVGTGILLVTYRLACRAQNARHTRRLLMLAGVLSGFGFWVHLQIAPYLVAAGCFCLLTRRRIVTFKNSLLVIPCFLLGSSPLVIYNLTHHGGTLFYFLDMFAPRSDSTSTFVSRLYNCIVVNLPALLGDVPMWTFHWFGFPWNLPVALNEFISISLLVILSILSATICIFRVRADPTFCSSLSATRRTLLWVGGIMMFAILLVELVILGLYLYEFIPLLQGDAITWSQFPGAPVLTPSFLLTELFSPSLWFYLLYLPVVVSAGYIVLLRRGTHHTQLLLLLLTLIAVMGSALVTNFGEIRWPAYYMPIYSVVPILFAWFVTRIAQYAKWLARLLPVTLCAFYLAGLLIIPPKLYLQPLFYVNWWNMGQGQLLPTSNADAIAFLRSQHISCVYAKFWLAYPLTFDSHEQIIASTSVQGRYPPHDRLVQQAQTVAYLFHMRSSENVAFAAILNQAHISYQKQRIVPYDIYYNVNLKDRFSSPLWPTISKLINAM